MGRPGQSRVRAMCTFALELLAGTAFAAAAPGAWFDAGLADYTRWADDGRDFAIPGVGVWRGTEATYLASAAPEAAVGFHAHPDLLAFDFAAPKPSTVEPAVTVTAVMPPMRKLPAITSDMKGAFFAYVESEGVTNYWGLVGSRSGGTNRWMRLEGASPKGREPVTLTLATRVVDDAYQVRYTVDGVDLNRAGSVWLPLYREVADSVVTGVAFAGAGEVRALAGTTAEEAGATVALTIPELTGMTVAGVSVGGRAVTAADDGTYPVPAGALVAVTFRANDGYFLSGTFMTFTAGESAMTLPAAGRPVALAARDYLRINEVMADNAAGLSPTDGIGHPDWIEVWNASDDPVDLAGWLLSDKAPKKDKWVAIEGPAVVPAHGALVIFLDERATWDAADAHAALGLSADGESVTLATPGKSVVDSVTFGLQFADVSYGRLAEGDTFAYFPAPTPGRANGAEGRSAPTPVVAFSEPHGYKTAPFALALACPDAPEAVIRYTTDGTSPNASSPRYQGPISVAGTTVVRAAVVDAGAIFQRDASATYLFVDDIVRQSGVPAGFPSDRSVNNQAMAYGMRSSILGSDGARLYAGFTNAVRTVSLVVDLQNLFNASTGIYVNARQEGRAWERQTMVEQINPADASDEYSTACGLRIRGGASRTSAYPRHSFRLFFRGDYGARKLEHPLFGDEGADAFDKIDLRADQNQSYANGDARETLVHDVFSRDTSRDLGAPYHRTRYFNLFINGIYWGLYMYEERMSQDYAASYFGGKASHYDVIRTAQPGYVTGIVEGETEPTEDFLAHVYDEGFDGTYPFNYNRVRGLNPDGTRNPEFPVYLNVTNLVDFMLASHLVADSDSPASATCFINQENNVMAFRNRVDGESDADGYRFCRHDAEWAMGFTARYYDAARAAAYDSTALGRNFTTFSPATFHWKLCENAAYRRVVADRFYKHCLRAGGVLTTEKCLARFRARMDELDTAIACEVARWGGVPSTHANRTTWLNACETYCLDFLRQRMPYHLQYYRARGWYPQVDAPTLLTAAGETVADESTFPQGTRLAFASVAGEIFYTTDGRDPCGELDLPATGAVRATGAGFVVPLGVARVRARARANGEWSALEEVSVRGIDDNAGRLAASLRVAAVLSSTREEKGDGAEFLVLTNLDQTARLELAGVRLTCAKAGRDPSLDVTLAEGTVLAPGGRLTLRRADLWPTMKITNGAVDGYLYDAQGAVLQHFAFDANWWDKACDGTGAFFVARAYETEVTAIDQWRASFPAPQDETGAAAVATLVETREEVRDWLATLGGTSEGAAAIAAFAADAAQLSACYLFNVAPTNAVLRLWIPRFAVDADGRGFHLDGSLRVGEAETPCVLNGLLRLEHLATPVGPVRETFELGRELPLPPARGYIPRESGATGGFYRLGAE